MYGLLFEVYLFDLISRTLICKLFSSQHVMCVASKIWLRIRLLISYQLSFCVDWSRKTLWKVETLLIRQFEVNFTYCPLPPLAAGVSYILWLSSNWQDFVTKLHANKLHVKIQGDKHVGLQVDQRGQIRFLFSCRLILFSLLVHRGWFCLLGLAH